MARGTVVVRVAPDFFCVSVPVGRIVARSCSIPDVLRWGAAFFCVAVVFGMGRMVVGLAGPCAPMRDAARTVSSETAPNAPHVPIMTRHRPKSALKPFIPLIPGNASKFMKARASRKYIKCHKCLVRIGGLEPPRILSTASLVLSVYQFRHIRTMV